MSSASPGGSSTALVHEGWDHLRAGRPLAAWASWQRALRLEDGSPAAAQAMATLESAADLPAAARAVYRLRTPSDAARRAAWDERLRGRRRARCRQRPRRARGRGPRGDGRRVRPAGGGGARGPGRLVQPGALPGLAGLQPRGGRRPGTRGRAGGGPGPRPRGRGLDAGRGPAPGAGAEDLADDLRFACTIDWDPGDTPELLAEFPEIQRVPTPQAPGVDRRRRSRSSNGWISGCRAPSHRPATAAGLPIVLASVIVEPASRTLRLSSPRVETLQQAEERLFSAARDRRRAADRRR